MNDTQSTFDSMTQAILDRKRGAAAAGGQARLTPVGMEARPSPAPPAPTLAAPMGAGLPDRDADMFEAPPRHQLWVFAESIRDMIKAGEALLAALPASNAVPVTLAEAVAPEDLQKVKERLADELFAEQFRKKQEEAQAAAFAATKPDESVGYTHSHTEDGKRHIGCSACFPS